MDHDRLQRRAFGSTLMDLTVPYILSNYDFFFTNGHPPQNLLVSYCFVFRKINFARVALSRSYLETFDLHLRRRHCVVSLIFVSPVESTKSHSCPKNVALERKLIYHSDSVSDSVRSLECLM
jgi:hypothetical protein